MSNPNGDKPGNEKFLNGLVEELQTMSDTDVLEGENAEALVKLGERLLKGAREEAGKLRMAEAQRKLSVAPTLQSTDRPPTVAEARHFLASHADLTLAARGLNELSDDDVLDLFNQAKSLEKAVDDDEEGSNG